MLASYFVFEVEPKHRWIIRFGRERIEIRENNLGRQSTGPQQNIAQAHSKTQVRLSRAPAQPTGDIFDNSLLPRTLTIYVQTSGRRGDFSPREINHSIPTCLHQCHKTANWRSDTMLQNPTWWNVHFFFSTKKNVQNLPHII